MAGTDNRWWLLHARLMVARGEIARGDPGAAAALAAAQALVPPGRTFPLLTWLTQGAEGRLCLAEGRPAEALDLARRIARECGVDAIIGRAQTALPLAVAAFADVGDATRAAQALGALERYEQDAARADGAAMTLEDVTAWLADDGGSR